MRQLAKLHCALRVLWHNVPQRLRPDPESTMHAQRVVRTIWTTLIVAMLVFPTRAYASNHNDDVPVRCEWANAMKPTVNILVGNLKGLVGSVAGPIIVALIAIIILVAAFEFRNTIMRVILWVVGGFIALSVALPVLDPVLPNWC